MGRGASFEYIEKETDHLPVGYFWCEIFQGSTFKCRLLIMEIKKLLQRVLGIKIILYGSLTGGLELMM